MLENSILKYATVMQKLFMKISQESGRSAEWNFLEINRSSPAAFIVWILSQSPESLRKGIILPQNISHREFFDIVATQLFGNNYRTQLTVQNMFEQNSVLPVDQSEIRMEALGRFVALSFLEMEPLFMPFSPEIIAAFLNKSTTTNRLFIGFLNGFHALIEPAEIANLSVEELTLILVGGDVSSKYVSIDDASLRNEDIQRRIRENPNAIQTWATVEADARGVAQGHFGRNIELKISMAQNQPQRYTRRGGWHISVSSDELNNEQQ